MVKVTSISVAIINGICAPSLRGPQDNFTLLWFSVSLSPSKLETPTDIESPLTAKAIMRIPCEGRGRAEEDTDGGSCEELDLTDPPGLEGLSPPKELDAMPWGH